MDIKKVTKQEMLNTIKFLTPLNRIILYYETVFNIKIENVFYKKKEMQELVKNSAVNLGIYDNLIKSPVIIIIKDNDNKFFKKRILKSFLEEIELNPETNKIYEGEEIIAHLIDIRLSKYCMNKYFNKNNKNNEKITEIYNKNEKINCEYQNWIKENIN